MAYNKVVYGGNTIMDISNDTVTAESLLSGYTAHDADGELIEGSCEYDADTRDATAVSAEILSGKTAYVGGTKISGSMINRASVSGTIATKDGSYIIPQGYHNGSGTVEISAVERDKLIAGNIKNGVSILGVTGIYSGETPNLQQKSVTPGVYSKEVLPDSGYYLTKVTVSAIPYAEELNSAGGTTVMIG